MFGPNISFLFHRRKRVHFVSISLEQPRPIKVYRSREFILGKQYSTNPCRQFAVATELFTLASNIFGPEVWNFPILQPTNCTCYLKLFILVKRSTCFGRSFRPLSGAQLRILSLSLSNSATAQGGPRPPLGVSFNLPGLGRLLSSFYNLASPKVSFPCLV